MKYYPIFNAGPGATVRIASVSPLQPGSAPTVENVGDDTAVLLKFGIPVQGPVGGDPEFIALQVAVDALPAPIMGVLETATPTDKGRFVYRQITSPDDGPVYRVQRDANHTGGTSGAVNQAGLFTTTAGAGNTNFEWALTGQLLNYTTGNQQNTGVYGQVQNYSDGNTWAGCFESRDVTPIRNPTRVKLGIEVGMFAAGPDDNNNRVAIDVPFHNSTPDVEQYVIGNGVRLSGGFTPYKTTVRIGFSLNNVYFERGFSTVGAAMNTVPYSGALCLANYHRVSWSETVERYTRYVPGKWQWNSDTVELASITDGGIVGAASGFAVADKKILGARQPAISSLTSTTGDVAVMNKVNSIIQTLRDHGLIEP